MYEKLSKIVSIKVRSMSNVYDTMSISYASTVHLFAAGSTITHACIIIIIEGPGVYKTEQDHPPTHTHTC